jgi:hypothetical protein
MQPIVQILAQAQTLVARLANIGKLDQADAKVSTRAPASTALSTGQWTGTKAGYLDSNVSTIATQTSADTASNTVFNTLLNVDNYLSTLLTSIVKSSQSGYLGTVGINTYNATAGLREYYADVTISAVSDISKCLVLVNGFFVDAQFQIVSVTYNRITQPIGYLTSATNLRISGFAYQDTKATTFGAANAYVRWTVIEFP